MDMDEISPARARRLEWRLSGTENLGAAEEYRASVASLFDVRTKSGLDFRNHVESYNFTTAVFGRCRSGPQTFIRSRAAARLDGHDQIQIIGQLSGSFRAGYDGRAVRGGAGSLRLVDMSRPLTAEHSAFDTLNLLIPREALGAHWTDRDIHGATFDSSHAGARLLMSHLQCLWAEIDALSEDEAAAGAAAATALAGGILMGRRDLDPAHHKPVARTLRRLACRFIDGRMGPDGLSPQAISLHLGVSRRTLYRLFERDGGIAAYIQRRRLERAFEALVKSTGDRCGSIAEVAYAHGFRSDAHFSRAFMDRFGVRPGELRQSGLAHAQPKRATYSSEESIFSWLEDL